jgi:hypothetical protein
LIQPAPSCGHTAFDSTNRLEILARSLSVRLILASGFLRRNNAVALPGWLRALVTA